MNVLRPAADDSAANVRFNQVGEPLTRTDAPGKATGRTRYAGDYSMPGMLHAKVVRAGLASARLGRLDVSKARALPGVACVITGADLPDRMAATDIPMLFLDRQLCIKRYTAPMRQIFNLKQHDHGRPIGDLTHALAYDELERDAAQVLNNLTPVERTVKLRDTGQSLAVRIRPYRTAEDRIDGVVVTFVR